MKESRKIKLNELNYFDHPLFGALLMVSPVDHPDHGTFDVLGCPVKLSDSPVDLKSAPLLGQHGAEILSDVLGYNSSQVDAITA